MKELSRTYSGKGSLKKFCQDVKDAGFGVNDNWAEMEGYRLKGIFPSQDMVGNGLSSDKVVGYIETGTNIDYLRVSVNTGTERSGDLISFLEKY